MSNGIRLELSSLPELHPERGDVLLECYALAAMTRLCVDPTRLSSFTWEREIVIEHTPRQGPMVTHRAIICWDGIATHAKCQRAMRTIPARSLTEHAAIVVAALTISAFEGARIVEVLEPGAGGDYHLEVDWQPEPVQLEVSGLRSDLTPSGADTRERVKQKAEQVKLGYVSVTAFEHLSSGVVHSVLCFADSDRPTPPET